MRQHGLEIELRVGGDRRHVLKHGLAVRAGLDEHVAVAPMDAMRGGEHRSPTIIVPVQKLPPEPTNITSGWLCAFGVSGAPPTIAVAGVIIKMKAPNAAPITTRIQAVMPQSE